MIWFSERKELEKQYYEWIKENGIADQPNSVIAFLEINGLLQNEKVHEKAGIVKSKPKTNFDKIVSSVESLVEFFETNGLSCDNNAAKNRKCHRQGCTVCLKEWLQQEAD